MIVQGSNTPIVLTFDTNAEKLKDISVALVKNGKVLYQWGKVDDDAEMRFDGKTVYCLLDQTVSIKLPAGLCQVKAKWLDEDGQIEFGKTYYETIIPWEDKTILKERD